MKRLFLFFVLFLVTTVAFGVDKTFKAASGDLILDASDDVVVTKFLGVGTNEPNAELEVANSGSVWTILNSSGGGNVDTGVELQHANTTKWKLYTYGGLGLDVLYLNSNIANVMSFTQTGKVEINGGGTAPSGFDLKVKSIATTGGGDSNFVMSLYNGSKMLGGFYKSHDSGGILALKKNDGTSNGIWLMGEGNSTITGGNLGVGGAADANFKLFVDNGAGNYGLKVMAGNNGDSNESVFEAWNWQINGSNPQLLFKIRGDGKTGFGTATPTGLVHIKGTDIHQFKLENNNGLKWTMYTDQSNNRLYIVDNDGDHGMYMAMDTTTWVANTSDQRLKGNIRDYPSVLNKLMKLKPRLWDWKIGGKKDDGFVAQEVAEVFPDALVENEIISEKERDFIDGDTKYTYELDFDPLLVKAIQEQQVIIEDQKSKISLMSSWICSQDNAPEKLCN